MSTVKVSTGPIAYRPRWPGPIEGRAYNLTKQWYPRFAAQMEFDDLIQESYIIFLKCQQRYSKPVGGQALVDNPAWFMSLFSVALLNRFRTLWHKNPVYLSAEALAEQEALEPLALQARRWARSTEPVEEDLGYRWRVIQELPADMRELLAALAFEGVLDLPACSRWQALRGLPAELRRLLAGAAVDGVTVVRLLQQRFRALGTAR